MILYKSQKLQIRWEALCDKAIYQVQYKVLLRCTPGSLWLKSAIIHRE